MDALRLLALLIYTGGAFVYGAVFGLWLRERGRADFTPSRGSTVAQCGLARPDTRKVAAVSGAMLAACFAWFVLHVVMTVRQFGSPGPQWALQSVQLWLAFLFPPLLVHISYAYASRDANVGHAWRLPIWPAYLITQTIAVWSLLVLWDIAPPLPIPVQRVINYGISISFIGAALYAVGLMRRSSSTRDSFRRAQSRRWAIAMYVVMAVIFALVLVVGAGDRGLETAGDLIGIASRSLPLAPIFLFTYFDSRFEFFDLFVKRGLWLLQTVMLLAAAFSFALPMLETLDAGWAAPWIYAIVILPVVALALWLYGQTGRQLDCRWLGRRFTTVEAVKHFLSGLRSATNEAQLVERAEQGLTEIFDAQACVRLSGASNVSAAPLDGSDGPGFPVVQEADVRSGDARTGRILMGRRSNEAPYFSEDVALLTSLSDVLGSVVDNLRLQRREQEQDQRARELTLHASRSELKALRAQINPHFFFNALNAIAGLIHKDPSVADRTIEQLADVFRYALRGGENEWAVLDEELEFARAYLEVEQARFGSRLQVDVHLEDDVRGARVPTMMVQTLVENAVKHGVAQVRGSASIDVAARSDQGRLVVTVSDTGPGFADLPPRSDGRPRAPAAPKSSGYGLANIRQRLDGYFGADAALTIERDGERGRTIVAVSLPFELYRHRPPVVAHAS